MPNLLRNPLTMHCYKMKLVEMMSNGVCFGSYHVLRDGYIFFGWQDRSAYLLIVSVSNGVYVIKEDVLYVWWKTNLAYIIEEFAKSPRGESFILPVLRVATFFAQLRSFAIPKSSPDGASQGNPGISEGSDSFLVEIYISSEKFSSKARLSEKAGLDKEGISSFVANLLSGSSSGKRGAPIGELLERASLPIYFLVMRRFGLFPLRLLNSSR
ncbi:hypothetical protein COLO4_02131 [Corchorus olitorius]|uniref:Uncharacterized protein n=1 Tax=Corchorus olitorius TaxID=93759 RepID=A0A1R3L1I2_9ROSI|nr:hypothetical protein COLO4_02131 [Corchorus olitorius]